MCCQAQWFTALLLSLPTFLFTTDGSQVVTLCGEYNRRAISVWGDKGFEVRSEVFVPSKTILQ